MARRILMPGDTQPPQRYVWDNIMRNAQIKEGGKSILDIGPGRTFFAGMMASWDNQVTVVDRLRDVLQWQARIIHGNKVYMNLHLADGEALPFPDRYFDLVTACWSIANIENGDSSPELSYTEARRVAKHMLFTAVNFAPEGGVRHSQYSGKEKVFDIDAVDRLLEQSRAQGWLVDQVSFLRADGQQVSHHIVKDVKASLRGAHGGPADHALIALRRD